MAPEQELTRRVGAPDNAMWPIPTVVRLAWAAIWLVFLGYPIADIIGTGYSPTKAVIAWICLLGFAATYLFAMWICLTLVPRVATGVLAGLPLAIKDVLCVRGTPTTAGSRILAGYQSPYTATAVQRLLDAGVVVLGKTNCDEFAMGSSNENSAFGPVRNPVAPDRVPGGSSGGSAAAVATTAAPDPPRAPLHRNGDGGRRRVRPSRAADRL